MSQQQVPSHVEDPLNERLLAAATEVFAEHGYAGAKVAEIARRAGLTTGAIYSRFEGKAQLLAEAITANTDKEFESLFSDHRFEGRMEDVLRIAGSHLVLRDAGDGSMAASAPGMLLESFTAARHESDVADLLRSRMTDRQERLGAIIDSAKSTGGIDPAIDTHTLVTFCHALGLGFLLLEAVDTPAPDTRSWESLIARLLAAIATPNTSDA